ncbi:YeiH family protein [Salinicoccus albus]|uniref:YeiH family protein n=1 Tax=Salinicoccus albus TaxID=418756 RepID=UPI00037EF910|nr:putative sulfate exporter family transporter [Salinicoccus albus]
MHKLTDTGFIAGIFFTFLIAVIGMILSNFPGLEYIGPLATAIIIAFLYRQFFGYPVRLKSGIQFSSKVLLRAAIILYGLKLNIDLIISEGLTLLLQSAVVVVFSIVSAYLFAKVLKADMNITMLLGVGTGVCGAAAIAAAAPILKSKDEDTAVSIGIIAFLGTVFSIGYIIAEPYLSLDVLSYGIWSGLSLHELAHVALAAEPMGEDVLAVALMAKLSRVLLLVPLCFILVLIMNRKNSAGGAGKIVFPYFLIGFILMSLLNSYVLGDHIVVPEAVMDRISELTSVILTMAMAALGLNISLSETMKRALKPLIAITVVSVLLSIIVYMMLI